MQACKHVCLYVCMYVCMYVCFLLELQVSRAFWPGSTVAAASVGLVLVVVGSPLEVVDFNFCRLIGCCWWAGVHGQCRQPLIEIVMFLFVQSGVEVEPLRRWLGSVCLWCRLGEPLALAACGVFLLEEVTERRGASGGCTFAWLVQSLGGYESTLAIQVPLDPTLRALDFLPNLP